MNPKVASCACYKCIRACRSVPGGLMPDDVQPLADLLGLSAHEVVAGYLVIDYYISEIDMEFLRPAKVDGDWGLVEPTGEKVSCGWSFTEGHCIFLDEHDRCMVHGAKPWNCRMVLACDPEHDGLAGRKAGDINLALAQAWAGVDIRQRYGLHA